MAHRNMIKAGKMKTHNKGDRHKVARSAHNAGHLTLKVGRKSSARKHHGSKKAMLT